MEIIKATPTFNYQLYFQEPVSSGPCQLTEGFVLSPSSLLLPDGLICVCPLEFSVASVRKVFHKKA